MRRPALLFPLVILGLAAALRGQDSLCYVGTYTNGGKSKGIYAFRLETQNADGAQTLRVVPLGVAAESPNPSFLEIDARRRLVFAVNEINTFNGKPTGTVSAFAMEPGTAQLKLINQVSSGGTGPCHLVLDRTGQNLIVANYGAGTVALIRVAADGRLSEPQAVIQHAGKSVNPQRQQGPHAHCVTLDPTNKIAFVCDLGLDQIVAYRFDPGQGKLSADASLTVATQPGVGPRHMVFRPDGKFAYVINELSSSVTAYAYDAATGRLTERRTLSTLPAQFDGKSSGAEIAVHPSGRWLYASNRGHDTVVVFDIQRQTGELTLAAEQATGGKTPRHFGLQPNAKHLVVANQNSDTLQICRVDQANGRLQPSGVSFECPAPVCVLFAPLPGK